MRRKYARVCVCVCVKTSLCPRLSGCCCSWRAKISRAYAVLSRASRRSPIFATTTGESPASNHGMDLEFSLCVCESAS